MAAGETIEMKFLDEIFKAWESLGVSRILLLILTVLWIRGGCNESRIANLEKRVETLQQRR